MFDELITVQGGELWVESVPLQAIAEAEGTPVYIYGARRLSQNVKHIRTAFASLNPAIHYSLKANANVAIVRLLAAHGLGADAVSGGEIHMAIRAGISPDRIVFAGVGKTPAELRYALETGIGWFNVESETELVCLNDLAGEMRQVARVALRLNPDVHARTHAHIATGHGGAKFGVPPDRITRLLDEAHRFPHVRIEGLHVHIGSQLGDVDATLSAVRQAIALASPYPAVRTLNIGGGFPVRYLPSDDLPSLEDFARALTPLLDGWQVIMEPGRAVVADAGLLLVTVLVIKEQGGHRFVVTDGSMTDLLRPALYNAIHPVLPVKPSAGEPTPCLVVGPVCESADVLNSDAWLPPVQVGDRLVITGTGAYGMSMASNYNMRPRASEVLVDGDRWRLIRRRETWQDLLHLQEGL